MRIFTTLCTLATAGLLSSCGQQQPAPEIDPLLGRACFQQKLPSLPPGSQYEGIQGTDGKRLTIKVMDGHGVISVHCDLADDGSLRTN